MSIEPEDDGCGGCGGHRGGVTERDLLDHLVGIDPRRAEAALDGAFDACASDLETGRLIDELADAFPGLAAITRHVGERIVEEDEGTERASDTVLGAAMALLAVIRYAHAERLRREVNGDEVRGDDK